MGENLSPATVMEKRRHNPALPLRRPEVGCAGLARLARAVQFGRQAPDLHVIMSRLHLAMRRTAFRSDLHQSRRKADGAPLH